MEIPAAGSHVTRTLLPRIKSIGSSHAHAFHSLLFCCNCVFATPKMYFCAPITLNIHLYFASSGSSGEVLVHLWHLWLLAADQPLPRPQNLSRLVSTTIYTLLKLWQCGTRSWPDKESKDWEHTSCETGQIFFFRKTAFST